MMESVNYSLPTVEKDLRTFQRLLLIFVRANYSLHNFLKEIENNPNAMTALQNRRNKGIEKQNFFSEINDRLFYSSAAMTTLIEISDVVMNKYSDHDFFHQFESTNGIIKNHNSSLLLRAMRNYSIHGEELPIIVSSRSNENVQENYIALDTKAFEAIRREDKLVKRDERYFKLDAFLKTSGESIDLASLMEDYLDSMFKLWSEFLRGFRRYYNQTNHQHLKLRIK